VEKLSHAIQQAEQVAFHLGKLKEGRGSEFTVMPEDPVLEKIIEVASNYLNEPDIYDAFKFPVAHDFAR